MSTYTDFKAEWNGRRVDYDHVYSYQCVDLILQYVAEKYGLPSGVWGNAIDYWQRPSPNLLTKFSLIGGRDCQQGDIVVLYGLPGNPYGHIGICESQDANNVTMLEQNGAGSGTGTGKDAIGIWRTISKNRLAGILRPKAAAPPPPAPAPARAEVFLPGSERTWNLYYVGSYLRPKTTDVKAVLAPYLYGGLTYKIVSWVGDYAVVIDTQMFGRGVIWTKNTPAQIR